MTRLPPPAQPFLAAITQHMTAFREGLELGEPLVALVDHLRRAAAAANGAADEFNLAAVAALAPAPTTTPDTKGRMP